VRNQSIVVIATLIMLGIVGVAFAADNKVEINPPEKGSVSKQQGLEAWSRIMGAETLLCQTCHTTKNEDWENANETPHTAPRVAMSWALAPVEAHWFGQTSEQICAQLRNPETNGNRDMMQIAEHLNHDLILHWAWAPGGGREPAPYSLQEHVNDILAWGVADMPCPQD